MNKTKRLLLNTVIMSLFSISVSVIGMSFNSFISKRIGAEEMGVFSLIMSVYMFAMTLAISGVNLAATRLTAEEVALGRDGNLKKVVRVCLIYGFFFGVLAAILMWFGADFLGQSVLRSPMAVLPLRALAVSLPFSAMSSALSGYFNAVRQVTRGSIGLAVEQIVKYIACGILFSRGISCLEIAIATTISEVIGLLYRVAVYIFGKGKGTLAPRNARIIPRLMKIAIPVALSSYIKSALTSAKRIVVPIFLIMSGLGQQAAMQQYGVIQGMVLPLLMFPACFLAAFSALLVPEITQLHVRERNARISSAISQIFKVTIFFSICVCGILVFFAEELSGALYADAAVAPFVRILAFSVPIIYFDSIVDGLLKGLDRQVSVVWINIIDSVATIAMFAIILPRWGVSGYIAVFYLSELLNAVLSIYCLLRTTACRFNFKEWVVKPTVCILAALVIVSFLPWAHFTVGIGLAIGIYAFGLLGTGCL